MISCRVVCRDVYCRPLCGQLLVCLQSFVTNHRLLYFACFVPKKKISWDKIATFIPWQGWHTLNVTSRMLTKRCQQNHPSSKRCVIFRLFLHLSCLSSSSCQSRKSARNVQSEVSHFLCSRQTELPFSWPHTQTATFLFVLTPVSTVAYRELVSGGVSKSIKFKWLVKDGASKECHPLI